MFFKYCPNCSKTAVIHKGAYHCPVCGDIKSIMQQRRMLSVDVSTNTAEGEIKQINNETSKVIDNKPKPKHKQTFAEV